MPRYKISRYLRNLRRIARFVRKGQRILNRLAPDEVELHTPFSERVLDLCYYAAAEAQYCAGYAGVALPIGRTGVTLLTYVNLTPKCLSNSTNVAQCVVST